MVSKRTVIDLRCFFGDLALWGWAERPPARLLFPADIPRLDKPLPRALPPDADRDLMAAIGELADPFARTALTVLRGTGIRLGELLDLELDCVWDSASHGSWLPVACLRTTSCRTRGRLQRGCEAAGSGRRRSSLGPRRSPACKGSCA